jgi:hypothetical protein
MRKRKPLDSPPTGRRYDDECSEEEGDGLGVPRGVASILAIYIAIAVTLWILGHVYQFFQQ